MRIAMAVFGGAFCGLVIAWLSGCTPAQQAGAITATYTGTRIAACVESVLAEEEHRRALQHRLAEIEAEQEAERIRSAARESSPTVKEEIEKVLKDGASKE